MGILNACIEPIAFAFFPVTNGIDEGFHVRIFFEVTKQFKQEKADRVIGESDKRVFVGNNGSDKGKIYQRGDETG